MNRFSRVRARSFLFVSHASFLQHIRSKSTLVCTQSIISQKKNQENPSWGLGLFPERLPCPKCRFVCLILQCCLQLLSYNKRRSVQNVVKTSHHLFKQPGHALEQQASFDGSRSRPCRNVPPSNWLGARHGEPGEGGPHPPDPQKWYQGDPSQYLLPVGFGERSEPSGSRVAPRCRKRRGIVPGFGPPSGNWGPCSTRRIHWDPDRRARPNCATSHLPRCCSSSEHLTTVAPIAELPHGVPTSGK